MFSLELQTVPIYDISRIKHFKFTKITRYHVYHKSPHFYTYVTPSLLLLYTYYTLRCMKGVKQEGPPNSESTAELATNNGVEL